MPSETALTSSHGARNRWYRAWGIVRTRTPVASLKPVEVLVRLGYTRIRYRAGTGETFSAVDEHGIPTVIFVDVAHLSGGYPQPPVSRARVAWMERSCQAYLQDNTRARRARRLRRTAGRFCLDGEVARHRPARHRLGVRDRPPAPQADACQGADSGSGAWSLMRDGACSQGSVPAGTLRVTVASVLRMVESGGDGWWRGCGGLQWSPTNLVDGRPYHGAARFVLSVAALSEGTAERRWATADELSELGYRIRRADLDKGIDVYGKRGAALYNASLGRRRRDVPGRHDGLVPAEAAAHTDLAESLLAMGGRLPDTEAIVRALAIAAIPRRRKLSGGQAELLPLVEDITCAMTLSSLGVGHHSGTLAESGVDACRTAPWTALIEREHSLLLACVEEAEALAESLVAAVRVEATRRARRESYGAGAACGRSHAQEASPQTPTRLPAAPSARQDASGDTPPKPSDAPPHSREEGRHPPEGGHPYTLHGTVAESQRASSSFGKTSGGRFGHRP